MPELGRAEHDVEGGFAIARMRKGVRITAGEELENRDDQNNDTKIKRAVAEARKRHKMKAEIDDETWMGRSQK